MYNGQVAFEWDPRKAASNKRRHGVSFTDAMHVFGDNYAITIQDDVSDIDELRFAAIGMGARERLLVVVFCYRGDKIRIISARPATNPECELYQEKR